MQVAGKIALQAVGVALLVASLVTGLVTLASAFLPDRYVATGVGLVFFGATWAMVWRKDDEAVERAGLAFGGLVLPGKLEWRRVGRDTRMALGWALVLALLAFGPFYVGWRYWAELVWHSHARFVLHMAPLAALNDLAGQVVLIALPEEAFYRGYLQSTFDLAFPPRLRLFGAEVGPAIVMTSAIFAVGHFATQHDPGRLAVFFPSLVFGWLRAKTGGVGASVAFHAACNVFSEALMRGYGIH